MERLEEARLHDIINWLWIELAMATHEPGTAECLLDRMGQGVTNRHMRLLMDLARLRAALLPDAPTVTAGTEAAEELTQVVRRLAGEEPAEGPGNAPGGRVAAVSLRALEVAERPYGWWLLRRFNDRYGAALLGAAPGWLAETEESSVQHALEQQGAGLPKALRANLSELPAKWAADLGAD